MKNDDALPLVSVVIPVFNGSNYLSNAIESVLKQDYQNIEIIIVNDGSTDNGKTREVALSYSSRALYYEKSNGGVSSALNLGIDHASGRYVVWLSHDDEMSPKQISNEVRIAHKYKNRSSVIFCDTTYIDSKERKIFKITKRILFSKTFKSPSFIFDYSINGCSLLTPKEYLLKWRFSEQDKYMPDTIEWYNFVSNGITFAYLNKRLAKSRIHGEQVTKHGGDLFTKEYSDFCQRVYSESLVKNDKKTIRHMLYSLALRGHRYPFEHDLLNKFLKDAKDKKIISLFSLLLCGFLSLLGMVLG